MLFLIARRILLDFLGKRRTIRTGIITEKQKIKVTSNTVIIFSDSSRLLRWTIETADKKRVKFLKLITDTIIPNPNDFKGVIVSREEKIGSECVFLDFTFWLNKFLNHNSRSIVPRMI